MILNLDIDTNRKLLIMRTFFYNSPNSHDGHLVIGWFKYRRKRRDSLPWSCLMFAEEASSFVERRTSRPRRSSAQSETIGVQRQVSLTLQGTWMRKPYDQMGPTFTDRL